MFKRIMSVFLSTVVIVGAFCACVDNNTGVTDRNENEIFYSFKDSVGNTVTLNKKPQKVAVLFSSLADLWICAGGDVMVTVGESIERGFCDEKVILVDDSAGKTINSELLLASGADFIIGSSDIDAQKDACLLARQAGIPSACIQVESFEDYLHWLRIFTDITQDGEKYIINGTEKKERIDKLLSLVKEQEQKEILFVRAGSKYSSTKAKNSEDNFAAAMLSEMGCINIADDVPVLLDGLSVEYIIDKNPQHIFLVTMGKEDSAKEYINNLFLQVEWQQLDAIKNSDYTFLPKDLFHFKPNSRWDEAYEYMIKILYPEIDTDAI